MVIHGTRDRMVSFPHGEELLAGLGGEESGITKIFIDGQGHVIPIEMRHEFNSWVEGFIARTEGEKHKSGDLNSHSNGHLNSSARPANGSAKTGKAPNGMMNKLGNGAAK